MKLNLYNKKFLKEGKIVFKMVSILLTFLLVFLCYQCWLEIKYFINDFNKIFKNDIQIFCFDVGQASANLIITPSGHAIMIDTSAQGGDLVDKVDYILQRNKIKEISMLILTHPDADHVGGTSEILKKFQVNNILRPKIYSKSEQKEYDYNFVYTVTYDQAIKSILSEPNCNVLFTEDCNLNFDETNVQIFAADLNKYSDTNCYSPYVCLTCEDKKFLFTGDAPFRREEEFMSEFENFDIDCLVVAHHGSKYSTSQEFLNFLTPEIAVISAGDFSHPSDETISRLKNASLQKIYCTKSQGDIALSVNGNIFAKYINFEIDFPLFVVCVFCVEFFVLNIFFEKKTQKNIYLRKK